MKLLVISLAGIGDTLFATPLIHELRANFPEAVIDALVLWKGSKDILEGNPHLNTVHQKNLIAESKAASLKFLWSLRAHQYDASLNTHPQSRIHYRLVARVINARTRLSHDYDHAGVMDRLLVNSTIKQDYGKHAIENNLEFLNLLGAKPLLARHDYEIFLSADEHQWAENFITQHQLAQRKRFGIHVGSGGTKNLALRRWPLSRYLELIKKLNQTHPGVAVVLFGGPEEEKDHEKILAEADRTQVVLARTQNIRQAAAILKRCDLFLSVDTALMHLAAAMNVPQQIVIETPTWNKPIEPYNNRFVLVKNPAVAGRNLEYYRYDGRGIQGTREELLQCMASVRVNDVLQVVNEVLGTNRA